MQEQSIFIEALEKQDPAERATYLDRVCASDPALRRRIEKLLQRHVQEDSVMKSVADQAELLAAFVHHLEEAEAPTADYVDTSLSQAKSLHALEAETIDQPTRPAGPGPTPLKGPSVPGYEILGELGRGGMGVVYKARHVVLQRLVALKMIRGGDSAGPRELQRFRIEAEAIARLQYPHIVQIFEIGEHEQLPFFALEFCAGGSLAKRLAGTPLPPLEAASLVEKLARAMDAAHAKGILHRDLKPGNILLAEDGSPKVTDFGLAKKLDEQGQTITGQVMGTPSYMAPEQAGAREKLGPACDIYALGAVLYECLTGRPPFKAATALETIQQVVGNEPVPPRQLNAQVPRDLETICLKCLQKEPARRYVSALALADDLRRLQAGEPIAARPISALEKAVKWARRKPAQAWVVAVSTAALLTILVGGAWFTNELRIESDKARRARDAEEERGRELQRQVIATKNALSQAQHNQTEAELNQSNAYLVAAANVLSGNGAPEIADHYLSLVPPAHRQWEWGYLQRQSEGALFTLKQTDIVRCVALSGDGRIASGSGRTVRIWDARTGQTLQELKGHGSDVVAVAFSGNGSRIVSTSLDAVRVWDSATGQLVRELRPPRGPHESLFSLAISSDASRIVSGSSAGNVWVWDAKTGQLQRRLKALVELRGRFPETIYSLALSGDGTRILSGSSEGRLRLWDIDNGAVLWERQQPSSDPGYVPSVKGVAFSGDGSRIASASQYSVRVWNASSGEPLLELKGHGHEVQSVAFSGDSSRIVSGARDHALFVWDAQSGQALLELKGHTDEVTSVAFAGDGTHIVSGSRDRTVRVWNARSSRPQVELRGHTDHVSSVAFSGDGSRIVSGSWDKSVRVWDAATYQPLLELKGLAAVSSVAVNGDGSLIVSGANCIMSGSGIVTTPAEKIVHVWNGKNGQIVHQLKGHAASVTSVALSGDGSRIVSGSADKTVRLWDAARGLELGKFTGHTDAVSCVAISGDGQRIAGGGGRTDKTVLVWDAGSGQTLGQLQGHTDSITSVAFSGDGNRIVSGARDQTVRVWDAHTGRALLELKGHTVHVTSVAFSRDGSRIVSGSFDKTVRVWDARTGQALLELKGHSPKGQVLSVAISDAAGRIISGCLDGVVRIWEARPLVPGVGTPIDDYELGRRLWLTRPDPLWHAQKRQEFDNLANGGRTPPGVSPAALHRAWEQQARGVLAFDKCDFRMASAHFIAAAALRPQPAPLAPLVNWRASGDTWAQLQLWDKAAAAYDKALNVDHDLDTVYLVERACLYLRKRDFDGYRDFCERMVNRFGRSQNRHTLGHLAQTLALSSRAPGSPTLARRLFSQCLDLTPSPSPFVWDYHVLGLAQYRAGEHGQAVIGLEKRLKDDPGWKHKVLHELVLAMAHHRLQHQIPARQWLTRARQEIAEINQTRPTLSFAFAPPGWTWFEWMIADMLLQEAQSLLEKNGM